MSGVPLSGSPVIRSGGRVEVVRGASSVVTPAPPLDSSTVRCTGVVGSRAAADDCSWRWSQPRRSSVDLSAADTHRLRLRHRRRDDTTNNAERKDALHADGQSEAAPGTAAGNENHLEQPTKVRQTDA